ncbi:ATP-binding protein [Paraburkholderia tagetis]|uniref:ATP-binding protein n=1 Tax=Paraburkholderia tagetis TaxID=2913261 RepID=A0A9X1UMQ9_9BURK|nr:ATP-binding protein [Paraburkholderia tagetis]MCG5078265.1 ATP-binding protein [Paraburkholderia tagetis]
MTDAFYTASLSRTQGRSTWAIIFRHPKRTDPTTGKTGLRVRQSLKTDDEQEAAKLRDDMNVLLSSPHLWDLGARDQALVALDTRVVDIFYYKLEGSETNFLDLREAAIALPSAQSSEYRRALLVGTTGAGKTTLLRQIIGTDPARERFPSTSTAKTTVHETEIILSEGAYRAVVTFFPMEDVREHLKECASAAVLAVYRGEPESEQMRRLLTHVNQRFRFNYVLGNGPVKEVSDFDDEPEAGEPSENSDLLRHTDEVLAQALAALKDVTLRHSDGLRQELNATDEKDQRVIDELFEEELDNRIRDDEAFQQVVDALMDEIEERFALLAEGKLQKTKVGWPVSWMLETEDRDAFIRTLARFSSNYAPLFGTLLTPLVNGVRVAGPFKPTWTNDVPKLALLDGEGLGHTPRSMSTISTTLAKRIEMVDAVILVDNATQPMLAAPVAAMKELVSSGSAPKLIFAFTHFDQVEGDNLPTPAARVHHVLASAENVLASIGEDLGPFAERALRARLTSTRVFLSSIDAKLDETSADGQRTIKQIDKLLEIVDGIVSRPKPADSRPAYDRMNLVLAVERAAETFRNAWRPRLGLTVKQGFEKEHWTRIKALSRRLATGIGDEYDSLRPVADLKQQLQQRLYVLLQNPISWSGPEPSDDDKQHLYDAIAEELSRKLIELASRRVRTERLSEWRSAFDESGPRSTFRRAELIAGQIYDRAAPIPDVTPSPDRNAFLQEVAEATREAAEFIGAKLL